MNPDYKHNKPYKENREIAIKIEKELQTKIEDILTYSLLIKNIEKSVVKLKRIKNIIKNQLFNNIFYIIILFSIKNEKNVY